MRIRMIATGIQRIVASVCWGRGHCIQSSLEGYTVCCPPPMRSVTLIFIVLCRFVHVCGTLYNFCIDICPIYDVQCVEYSIDVVGSVNQLVHAQLNE
jgi:hypothetical protein